MYVDSIKCLKCRSRKLQSCFGINDRGEAYKTCECCRAKDRVNRERKKEYTNNLKKDNNKTR